MALKLPTLLIIPTGIGCSLGGYAGDAIPAARLLAAASGCLITHPNVMNGAALYWSDSRIKYVEGYALDHFASGEIALKFVRKQKVGLLLDASLNSESKERHLQVAEACRASLGLDIGPVVTTDLPLEIGFKTAKTGTSWGTLDQPDALVEAGQKLKESGATAIAIVTRFPESSQPEVLEAYRRGEGVDELAGAEAVISHLLVKHLGIPCAHAPSLSALPLYSDLDPRAAAEELGHTFLTSVLVGLSHAPDLIPIKNEFYSEAASSLGILHVDQLGAVVVPNGALGGAALLSCIERGIPIIVVDNPNLLSVTEESLGLVDAQLGKEKNIVLRARNYTEAAGLVLLIREGINVDSLYRPLSHIDNF